MENREAWENEALGLHVGTAGFDITMKSLVLFVWWVFVNFFLGIKRRTSPRHRKDTIHWIPVHSGVVL